MHRHSRSLLILGIAIGGVVCAAEDGQPDRPMNVLEGVADDTTTNVLTHNTLFSREPAGPVVWPPPAPPDPSRTALGSLDQITSNDFSAPPLIVTRIAQLPARSGMSPEQISEHMERLQLREAVNSADALFREGQASNAIARLDALAPAMRNTRNRVLLLNRAAAYYFRQQQYERATELMKQAYDLDAGDSVAACNLAATLLTTGQAEEALRMLKGLPASALNRPQLAFSIHFNMACAYGLTRHVDEGIDSLARAAQTDPVSTAASLGDPQLDGLRGDSRFDSLARSLDAYLKRPGAGR